MNGKELKSLKHLESILQTQYGKLRLAVLPGMTRPNHKTSETRAHHSKGESDKRQKQKTDGNVTRAQDLFLKVGTLWYIHESVWLVSYFVAQLNFSITI